MRLQGACQRRKIAGHAGPAAVTHDAPLRRLCGGGSRAGLPAAGAAVELAPVDDHRDVVLVLVVVEELRIQLSASGLGTTQ